MKAILFFCTILVAILSRAEVQIQTAVDGTTGEELFLCNASLRHATLQNEQECLNLEDGTVCNPQQSGPKDGPCVCRSKVNFGDQIMGWDQNGRYQSIVGLNDWNSLIGSQYAFNNKLQKLEISLGSENLGAEYSVRFCYLGPQEVLVKQGTTTKDLTEAKYLVDISLAGSNYSQALDKVYFDYHCDYRYRGNQSGPRKKNELSPNQGIVENDDNGSFAIFGNGPGSRPGSVNFVQRALVLNSTSTQVPRFCVFEFKFKELSGRSLGRGENASQVNFLGKLRICKQGTCPTSL
ncbi:hypothetical protein ACLVWU_04440 [Bdellovibrio sp. HCB290]|uniref:hypothetical protein n=1 Tax=Bdellovibrio sp. HCB290 TaxID=3394356 RepID=UPI0039B3EF7A